MVRSAGVVKKIERIAKDIVRQEMLRQEPTRNLMIERDKAAMGTVLTVKGTYITVALSTGEIVRVSSGIRDLEKDEIVVVAGGKVLY